MKQKKCVYDFQQHETIRSFGKSICTSNNNIDEAEMDQVNLLKELAEFINRSRLKAPEGKDKKKECFWKCKCPLWRLRINT